MTVCSLQQNTDENMHPALDLYFFFSKDNAESPFSASGENGFRA